MAEKSINGAASKQLKLSKAESTVPQLDVDILFTMFEEQPVQDGAPSVKEANFIFGMPDDDTQNHDEALQYLQVDYYDQPSASRQDKPKPKESEEIKEEVKEAPKKLEAPATTTTEVAAEEKEKPVEPDAELLQ